jgi:uncharacterized membrane protein
MTSQATEPLSGGLRLTLAGLASMGLMISGYLAAVAIQSSQLPVGCAPEGGCAAVLSSRWAGSWGVPVALPATLLWGVALVAALRGTRAILAGIGPLVGLAALWFIGLQIVALGAFCPWCMADHAIGLLFSSAIAAAGLIRTRPLGFAMAGMAILIAGHLAVPYHPGKLGTLNGGASADGNAIVVGGAQFTPDREPTWGQTDADEVLLLFADYACPHCRAAHGQLKELLSREPRRFRVVVAPVPMDHDCNPTLAATEPRFEHSCELAHLAYAVWHADRTSFAAFDDWLFEPETPRSPEEARAEATRIVGAERLSASLAAISFKDRAERNVAAFEFVKAKRLPVLVRTKGASMEGEPSSSEELDAFLRRPDRDEAAVSDSTTGTP